VTVIKHITGPAARHHGRMAILVACGGPVSDFTLIIPARTALVSCRAISTTFRLDPAAA
jgi:hypothetical protein